MPRLDGVRHWTHDHPGGVLVMLAIMLALIAGAVQLTDAVFDQQTEAFDTELLLALREPGNPNDPVGPAWVEEVGRDVTAMGGMTVLCAVTLFASGYLVLVRHGRTALLLLVAVGSGLVLAWLLKGMYDRPRPDLVEHYSHVVTASFPSGHSMMAAVTYLTLATVVARAHARWSMRVYLYAAAVLVSLAVGASRVYVGVHWPTDVAAGWLLGAAWAVMWDVIARRLQRRTPRDTPLAIEPPEPSK